jgi:choline dehydrogenase-like flavoprotein
MGRSTPLFQETETFIPGLEMDQSHNPLIHGYEGPIKVSYVSSSGRNRNNPLKNMVVGIYAKAGIERTSDMNDDGFPLCYAESASNTYEGERQWVANYYPRGRNVTLWADTLTSKLIVEGKRVVGVEIFEKGKKVVRARKRCWFVVVRLEVRICSC